MLEFRKFNSIENKYREEFLISLHEQGLSEGTFVVTEKVHGANFSLWTNGKEVCSAKRTAFLTSEDQFYQYEAAVERYSQSLKKLWETLSASRELEQVAVFGELFGGAYPHPDVKRIKGVTTIQKGVWYAPHIDFYAFDILIDNEEYLAVDEANALFESCGFFYAKPLFEGKFADAINFPNTFNSKLPAWLGLPQIEENVCEGVVIRPLKALFTSGGSRVIIKNKNEKWSENLRRKKVVLDQDKISNRAAALRSIAEGYVTENRLNNVISKIGQVGPKEFGMVLGLYNQDVWVDFVSDYQKDLEQLEKKEQKYLRKALNARATGLLRKQMF